MTDDVAAVQGNLDPVVAAAGGEEMEDRVRGILDKACGSQGVTSSAWDTESSAIRLLRT